MKKKLKLFLSISSLCLALAVLCFGVYSAQIVNYSLSGNVTYTVEDAFVEVQTKLYKSTTNLTHSQLGLKVNDIAEMDFATTPEGLTLVDTSEVYSSISGAAGTYEKPNLSFSTQAGSECYAYFFVVNIKNLSPDINVWAVMEDELTNPANTVQINNGLQQTINQAGKNMVIGLTIDDYTQNIPTTNNAFRYGIKIGVGTYAMTEMNLNKLTLTLDATNNVYSVKAKDTSVKGVVVIPESYTTTSTEVSNLARNASYQSEALSEVVIPDGVTKIENGAFHNCTEITEVIIPSSVKSIGSDAFSGCTGLTSVIIPNGVTSIGGFAFQYCSGLTSVVIPDSVTNLGYVTFCGCVNLAEVSISNSISDIGSSVFAGCESLTSVVIPEGVKTLNNNAFEGCTRLTLIELPNSVTSISSNAFLGCTGLTEITVPSSVTSIAYNAFQDSGLEIIIVDESNTVYESKGNCLIVKSTKTLEMGFKSSTIPTDGSVTSIGDSAFKGRTGLNSIIIPSSVTSIGGSAFQDCTGLTTISIPSSVTSIGYSAFSDCTALHSVTIEEGLLRIEQSAFSGCTGLNSITIPSSVTNIGIYVFNDCRELERITVGMGNTVYTSRDTNNTEINCIVEKSTNTLIYGCKNSVIPTDGSVTCIGGNAFSGCTNMTQVTISDSVTRINSGAFAGCTGLTKVTIPSSVTYMENNVFEGCNSFKSITVEVGNPTYTSRDISGVEVNCIIGKSSNTLMYGCKNSVIPTDGSVTSIESFAFYCTDLTTVTIPSSVTSIGDQAFYNCTKLTDLIFENGVTTLGTSAFAGCTGLTRLTIPSSITNIGDGAFAGCTGLTEVTIENGVTSIESFAFSDTGLTQVIIPESVTSLGWAAFGDCTIVNNSENITSYTLPTVSGKSWYKNIVSDATKVTIINGLGTYICQ